MPFDNERDDVFAQEYDLAYPSEAEYEAWIKSIEAESAKLVVTNKTNIKIINDYSPFNTVNS